MTQSNVLQLAPFNLSSHYLNDDHPEFFRLVTGRTPTMFEKGTAQSLYEAAHQARNETGAFTAVSTATGSGKTQGAAALLWSNYKRLGMTGVLVIKSIEECDRVYQNLRLVLPAGVVAVLTSIHKANASKDKLKGYALEGVKPSASFTEDEFKAAPIAICTHERWINEVKDDKDRGVRMCNGKPRDLVIIDEEPSLDRIFVRRPSDISRLMDTLTDIAQIRGQSVLGFGGSHFAMPTLERIHTAMRETHDTADRIPWLYPQEALVTADDAAILERIPFADLADALVRLPPEQRGDRVDHDWETIEFLKAAAQGRIFYSKDDGGAFYAYAFALPVQPRTLVLDGTADINGMYAIGKHVRLSKLHLKPTYDNLRLVHITPPAEFKGKMKPDGLLKHRRLAGAYLDWFKDCLLVHTSPGEHILVYCKQDLLRFGIHEGWHEPTGEQHNAIATSDRPCWCDVCVAADSYRCHVAGRKVHWCHFGKGRGSNKWRHCTVGFRLGDFHAKKAVTLAKIGSMTGSRFDRAELDNLSSGTTRHRLYLQARDAHLLTCAKQDSARTAIRDLDDQGRPKAQCRLYFVDCEPYLLIKKQQALFPGSPPFEFSGSAGLKDAAQGQGPRMLLDMLNDSSDGVVTGDRIKRETGIDSNYIDRALSGSLCASLVEEQGWTKTTRKAVGLSGKGYVLMRGRAERAA